MSSNTCVCNDSYIRVIYYLESKLRAPIFPAAFELEKLDNGEAKPLIIVFRSGLQHRLNRNYVFILNFLPYSINPLARVLYNSIVYKNGVSRFSIENEIRARVCDKYPGVIRTAIFVTYSSHVAHL